MIEFDLPYPPSVNHYYRRVGPRTLISREGRRFRERVLSVLAATRPRPFDGPIAVQVEVYPPDHRRRDIDNVQKSLFDALQHGGVYRDDSQIVRLQIEKRGCVPGGMTIVRIEPLADAAPARTGGST
ncbi:MAG TPA: RusA family crossover junction endodeoxyribonuclease [Vicinamibacterales bacterium]|nr:RusA family crossover junction endodeoxyribonuclease [Vicinamibacterales bacterium]